MNWCFSLIFSQMLSKDIENSLLSSATYFYNWDFSLELSKVVLQKSDVLQSNNLGFFDTKSDVIVFNKGDMFQMVFALLFQKLE